MNSRFLSLLLAFALLINFSGLHALAVETWSVPSQIEGIHEHPDCAMHAHSEKSPADNACDKSAKRSHVCGALQCDCGCHLSALTITAFGIAGASHAAMLAMFQPQRVPLTPIKMSLRPPILA